jgi:hypothetical protein
MLMQSRSPLDEEKHRNSLARVVVVALVIGGGVSSYLLLNSDEKSGPDEDSPAVDTDDAVGQKPANAAVRVAIPSPGFGPGEDKAAPVGAMAPEIAKPKQPKQARREITTPFVQRQLPSARSGRKVLKQTSVPALARAVPAPDGKQGLAISPEFLAGVAQHPIEAAGPNSPPPQEELPAPLFGKSAEPATTLVRG